MIAVINVKTISDILQSSRSRVLLIMCIHFTTTFTVTIFFQLLLLQKYCTNSAITALVNIKLKQL